MRQGKQVKASTEPLFNEPVSLENIGTFIKARRTQQGLTTNDAAMLCNVSSYTLNKIENGFEGVKLSTLLQIMQGLGIKMKVEPWKN